MSHYRCDSCCILSSCLFQEQHSETLSVKDKKKRYGEVDGRVAGIYNSSLRLNIFFIKEIKLFHSG